MRRRTIAAAIAAVVSAGAFAAAPLGAAGPHVATFEVTIQDLTRGQPLTPPVVATHSAGTGMFTVGRPASFELKEIAENGRLAPMIERLGSDPHVFDTEAASAPLVPPHLPSSGMFDESVTLTVTAGRGANLISFASMLICTNDGFTGIDSLRLPHRVGETAVVWTNGYDAGTERNTEDYADIVPPCQGLFGVNVEPGTDVSNPALAEHGVIHHHAGIKGVADLMPRIHGWHDPVAKVTIERIG